MASCAVDCLGAYDALAPVYDEFTADHDYEGWVASLERIAVRHGLAGRRVLDLACGTGKSLLPWHRRGYATTGCDFSAEMLSRAAAKLPDSALHLADLRRLPALGTFDLVLLLDDVVNCLDSREDLETVFRNVAPLLSRDGLMMFDANCLATYRTTFAQDACNERDGRFFAWRGETPAAEPGGVAQATVDAFVPNTDGWTRITSVHRQRHHPLSQICDCLAASGLACHAVYGQHRDGRIDSSADEDLHTKAIFVASAYANHEPRR